MSAPLKYMYNVQFFEQLCPVLKEIIPDFEERKFIYHVFDTRWPELELKQRTRQITEALQRSLPPEYTTAVKMVVSISNHLRKKRDSLQSYPFIFLPDYIELHGMNHFSLSMDAIEESTKLVSAEFAIRPFIVRYPRETMKQMLIWSKHKDAAVRRLSSEGCRPRLPWSIGLPDFKADPSPILPILENLKSDPSEYVRRSVANNLNDIAKDHPEIVVDIAQKWRGISPETDWIVRHGCRTLLKRGHTRVLDIHGFNSNAQAQIKSFKASQNVPVGQSLSFSFTFFNKEKKSTSFRLEYAIDYLTRSGKTSRKIFKLTESLVAAEGIYIQRTKSFKDCTTRKHFQGRHCLRIFANGKELARKEFFVC